LAGQRWRSGRWPSGQVTPEHQADTLVKAYVNYLVGDGQKLLADLDYAPLSQSLQQQAVAQIGQIKVG